MEAQKIDRHEYARLLEGMTAEDIISSQEFKRALKSYASIEVRLMKRHMRSRFLATVPNGLNTALRMVMHNEWNADSLTQAFREVIARRSNRSANERELVRCICMKAYGAAMREIVDRISKTEINRNNGKT